MKCVARRALHRLPLVDGDRPGFCPGNRAPRLWRAVTAAMLICGATVAAYFPSLFGQFVWNDSEYVTRADLRSVDGLVRIWTELGATEQYYPLLHSAFWVQHRLWGGNPFGYPVVNVLLHAGAAVLLAMVLRRLKVSGAWLSAALFALHPVHVESVAGVTEQKNTLSLVLYPSAAMESPRRARPGRPRSYRPRR